MAVVLVTAAAFSFTTGVHAATSGSTVPMPPLGFKTPATVDLSQLVRKDPSVHVETLTLPAASCSAKELAQVGGKCKVLHYWKTAESNVLANGFAYWSWYDTVCSIAGCWLWKDNMQEDGVVNPQGTQTWNWNHYCTASGFSSQGWCGVINNGHYTIQYGSNFEACATKIGCVGHGMRRNISAGFPTGFDAW